MFIPTAGVATMATSTFENRTLVRLLGKREKCGLGIITKVHKPLLKTFFTYSGIIFLPDLRIEDSSRVVIAGIKIATFAQYERNEFYPQRTGLNTAAMQSLHGLKLKSDTFIGGIAQAKVSPDCLNDDGTFVILEDSDGILSGLRFFVRWKRTKPGTRDSLTPEARVDVKHFSSVPASQLEFTSYSICK